MDYQVGRVSVPERYLQQYIASQPTPSYPKPVASGTNETYYNVGGKKTAYSNLSENVKYGIKKAERRKEEKKEKEELDKAIGERILASGKSKLRRAKEIEREKLGIMIKNAQINAEEKRMNQKLEVKRKGYASNIERQNSIPIGQPSVIPINPNIPQPIVEKPNPIWDSAKYITSEFGKFQKGVENFFAPVPTKKEILTKEYEILSKDYAKYPQVIADPKQFKEATEKYNKLESMYKEITKPDERKLGSIGKIIEPTLTEIPKQQQQYKGSIPGEIVNVGLGAGKEILSTVASIENIGSQYIMPKITRKESDVRETKIPDTSAGLLIGGGLERKSGGELYSAQQEYIKKYGVGSVIGEYGTMLIPIPIKGGGLLKNLAPKKTPQIGKVPAPIKKPLTPFSLETPYKPSKRANEIDFGDAGEKQFVGVYTPLSAKKIFTQIEEPLKGKPTKIVQPDLSYKPSKRANEIDFTDMGEKQGKSSLVSSKPIAAKQSDVRFYVPPKAKVKTVQPDWTYRPTKRPTMIEKDNLLANFQSKEIRLGRGMTTAEKMIKPIKTVKEDLSYKPSKRANEIDYSDFGEKQGKASKITEKPVAATQKDIRLVGGKNTKTVKIDVDYKPSRPDKPMTERDDVLYGFTTTKIKLGKGTPILKKELIPPNESTVNPDVFKSTWKKPKNEFGRPRKFEEPKSDGKEIRTKSGQILILKPQVEKPILKTIQKKTEQKTIQKERKKKPVISTSPMITEEIILNKNRPQMAKNTPVIQIQETMQIQRMKSVVFTGQKQKESQRLEFSVTPKLAQKQKSDTKQKEKTRTRTVQRFVIQTDTVQRQTPRQKQPPRMIPRLKIPDPTKPKPIPEKPPIFVPKEKPKPITEKTPPRRLVVIPTGVGAKRGGKKAKTKPEYAADFLGASSESSVFGLSKRDDVTYGRKRTLRLSALDLRKREKVNALSNPEVVKFKRKSRQTNPDVFAEDTDKTRKKYKNTNQFQNTKNLTLGKKANLKSNFW